MKFGFKLSVFSIFVLALVGCTSVPTTKNDVALTGKRGSIALFPLTGARQEDGKAIISSLARQRLSEIFSLNRPGLNL